MGYVYLIKDEGNDLYKIGVTRDSSFNRLSVLQTGNPSKLSIIYKYKCKYPFRLETMLHNRFKELKVLNEWYELNPDHVREFLSVCDKLNNCIQALTENPFFSKNLT